MVTKDELKKEVDKIPDNLLEEAFALLKKVNQRRDKDQGSVVWNNWKKNLENFSADFMINRDQAIIQSRESFD